MKKSFKTVDALEILREGEKCILKKVHVEKKFYHAVMYDIALHEKTILEENESLNR